MRATFEDMFLAWLLLFALGIGTSTQLTLLQTHDYENTKNCKNNVWSSRRMRYWFHFDRLHDLLGGRRVEGFDGCGSLGMHAWGGNSIGKGGQACYVALWTVCIVTPGRVECRLEASIWAWLEGVCCAFSCLWLWLWLGSLIQIDMSSQNHAQSHTYSPITW